MFRNRVLSAGPAIYERLQREFNELSTKYKSMKFTPVDTPYGKSARIDGEFPVYVADDQYLVPIKISIPRDYPFSPPEVRAVLPHGCQFQSTQLTALTGQFVIARIRWHKNCTLLEILEWIREQSRECLIISPPVAKSCLELLTEVAYHEPPKSNPEVSKLEPLSTASSTEKLDERQPLKVAESKTEPRFDEIAAPERVAAPVPAVRPKNKKLVVATVASESKEDYVRDIKYLADARIQGIENQIRESERAVAVNAMTQELLWVLTEAIESDKRKCDELEEQLNVKPWEEPEEMRMVVEREASRQACQKTMEAMQNVYNEDQTPLSEYLSEIRMHAKNYFDFYVFPDLCEEYLYDE